jgi:thymidylate synthase ThyX
MVSQGIAKECARNVLPLGTQTKLYMNGSIRSWIHYLQLRCDPGTQFEHRQIAEWIKQIFCKEFPIIGEAVFQQGTPVKPEVNEWQIRKSRSFVFLIHLRHAWIQYLCVPVSFCC